MELAWVKRGEVKIQVFSGTRQKLAVYNLCSSSKTKGRGREEREVELEWEMKHPSYHKGWHYQARGTSSVIRGSCHFSH